MNRRPSYGAPHPPTDRRRGYRRAIDRRLFLQRAIVAGAGGAVLPLVPMATSGADPATPGESPYGPLAEQPDANGLRLPAGFTSRIVATAGEPVGDTDYAWHAFPDGAATFPDDTGDGGGWIYACNSEVTALVAPMAGGVSAIRFAADGSITDAYRILEGSTSNCAGGPTPWGTWLSCEEPVDGHGRLWECDPTGTEDAVAHLPAGIWRREAAAVDPEGKAVYLTEDDPAGLLYRYTPTAYPDLADGLLEAAVVDGRGAITWAEVPDPSAATAPTREQVPGATTFNGGEGIWHHDGFLWFTTKGDNQVHAIDLAGPTHEVIWKADPDASAEDAVLSGVDNITVDAGSGDLFVAEDSGNMELVVITPEGQVAPFAQIVGSDHDGSEVTGPCFNPARDRLYFSSQRGRTPRSVGDIVEGADPSTTTTNGGVTFEVTGPFRGTEEAVAPVAPTTTLAKAGDGGSTGDDDGDDDGVGTPVVVGGALVVAAAVGGGILAVRNRRTT